MDEGRHGGFGGYETTKEQYEKIEKYLPRQRGKVSMTYLQMINAIQYVTENGCKWRALPKTYGNWHTVYVRMNRWSKNGVLLTGVSGNPSYFVKQYFFDQKHCLALTLMVQNVQGEAMQLGHDAATRTMNQIRDSSSAEKVILL